MWKKKLVNHNESANIVFLSKLNSIIQNKPIFVPN